MIPKIEEGVNDQARLDPKPYPEELMMERRTQHRPLKLTDIKHLETFNGTIEHKLPALFVKDVVDDLEMLGVA